MSESKTNGKDVLMAVGALLLACGVSWAIGSICPMLIASDGFVEYLGGLY